MVEQTYGKEEEWEEHFQYLLPFFQDSRYEKLNNKPVFMLFIPCFDSRECVVRYFDKRCRDYGFDGICIIDTVINPKDVKKANDSKVERLWHFREPNISTSTYQAILKYIPYRAICRMMTKISKKYVFKYNGDTLFKVRTSFVSPYKYIPGVFLSGIIHLVMEEEDMLYLHLQRIAL